MNTQIQFDTINSSYDNMNKDAKFLNFGVRSDTAKWITRANNVSGEFVHNSYVVNGQSGLEMTFSSVFTATFWAKFPSGGLGVSDLTDTVFAIVLPDTTISYTIQNIDIDWHYYTITRDYNNNVVLRIDGTTVASGVSSEPFNLMEDSYIVLGNRQRYYTGYNVIADDILIVEGLLWKQDFDTNLPTDYLNLNLRYLYIVVSTGEVWGYSEDS